MAKTKAAVVDVQTSDATKSLADLRKQITGLKDDLYKLSEGSDEYESKLMELSLAQDELNGFMAKTRQGCAALEGSYNALSYQMGVLKQAWKNTNDEAEREVLGKQINEINDKLKELDESVGNHQRNVGNYTKSMQEAFQNVGITIGNINPLFANLANTMMASGEKGKTAFATLGTGVKGLAGQLKALAANPVGAVIMAVVVAVKAAKAIFDKFKESVARNQVAQENLQKAMAPVKAIINGITNAFDSFVEVLTSAAAAVGGFISKMSEFIGLNAQRVKDENALAEMQIENEALRQKYIVENSELESEAYDFRVEAAKKDKYTAEERIAFLEKYKEKQDKIAQNNLEMAKKNLAALELEAAQGKNSTEFNRQLAEAKAEVNRQQTEYKKKLVETEAQIGELKNSIKAEQEAEAKAITDKANKWAEELKRLKEEYKGIMGTIYDTLKEGDVEYQIEKLNEAHKERIKKLNEEYKKHAISKKEYDLAVYKSEDLLYRQTKKLREDEAKALEEFRQDYDLFTANDTKKQLSANERAFKAEHEKLLDMAKNLTDEEFAYRESQLQQYYSKLEKDIQMKGLEEKVAINQAYYDKIYKLDVSEAKRAYAAREMTAMEYFQREFDLKIEANQKEIELQQQLLEQTKNLYGEGTQEYNEIFLSTTALMNELEVENQQLMKEKQDALIDASIQRFALLSDSMSNFLTEISSIGDGLSSEWAKVLDTVTQGIFEVGNALKDSEGGWKSWSKVGIAALGAISGVLGALAAEQDETSREGFETKKKLSISQAVISTIMGIMDAWAGAMQWPFPANVIIGGIMSGMMAGIGAYQISQISKTQYGDGSSASAASAGSGVGVVNQDAVSSVVAPVQFSTNVEGASVSEKVADTRVYVVESDISDTASKVSVAGSENRF